MRKLAIIAITTLHTKSQLSKCSTLPLVSTDCVRLGRLEPTAKETRRIKHDMWKQHYGSLWMIVCNNAYDYNKRQHTHDVKPAASGVGGRTNWLSIGSNMMFS